MGRISSIGTDLLRGHFSVDEEGLEAATGQDRVGMVLGTGWSLEEVLAEQGFEEEDRFDFPDLGINLGSGAGHPNHFSIGTWNEKKVVISRGRAHLKQVLNAIAKGDMEAFFYLRRWMGVLLALMGNGRRIILTCSAGGLGPDIKQGTILRPTDLISADLPTWAFLSPDEGEYAQADHWLWDDPELESNAGLGGGRHKVFCTAAGAAELDFTQRTTHRVITGPGFGGRAERKLWHSWGADSVGMSLDPDLRLLEVDQLFPEEGKEPVDRRVFTACYVSDDHDRPNNADIQAAALAAAPQLGEFLSSVLDQDWNLDWTPED